MKYKGGKELIKKIKEIFPGSEDILEFTSDISTLFSIINKATASIKKYKIKMFVNSLEELSNDKLNKILSDILGDEDKETIFLEILNKIIDLDDNLQIYLLAYLLKEYKINGNLNYYQKTLYYKGTSKNH